MTETIFTLLQYGAYILAGAIVALTAIAPLTKTQWDNKLLSALTWVHDKLLALVLPLHTSAAKTKPPTV